MATEKVRGYVRAINSALFEKLGEQVNEDHDYLNALFLYAGTELAHINEVLSDSEILKVVREGERIGRIAFKKSLKDGEG